MSSAVASATDTILLNSIKLLTGGAAEGTGVLLLVDTAKSLLGGTIPSFLVDYTLGVQLAIFGDYPTSTDKAPSAIFFAVFIIFMLAHLFIFFMNYSRGHKFWLSLGFAFYCLIRAIGWILRLVWADDILQIKVGIASSVLIIVPIVILASLNLVLAQRIFTWRHPHFGSSRLFWITMLAIYAFVAGVVVMAIVSAVVPYVYYLSEDNFNQCKKASRAAGVLCVLYSVLAILLVALSFVLSPTKKALALITYQPWWIESFEPLYYVKKGSAKAAEESFKSRDPDAFQHHRIIASTTQHHNTIEHIQTVSSKSGKLEHNYSIFIIFLTSVILLISSLFRCVALFIAGKKEDQGWLFEPVVQYMMFGFLEVVVNILYLVGRVDLRFYRPDRLSTNFVNACALSRRETAKGTMGGDDTSNENELEKGNLQDDSLHNTDSIHDSSIHNSESSHKADSVRRLEA